VSLTQIVAIALSAIIIVGIVAIAKLKNSRYKRMAEQCAADARREQALRRLSPVDREHFGREWQQVEAHFVEDPRNAVVEADRVVEELLSARGFSVPDSKAARNGDPGVALRVTTPAREDEKHPVAIETYQEAHEIVLKQATGHAHRQELRRAMLDYRVVFDELVGPPQDAQQADKWEEPAHARSGA
jgi:hypothetical protein